MQLAEKLKAMGNALWPKSLHPFVLAERKVRLAAQGRVISGPFAGMKLGTTSFCSAFMPKMLGTYECELHSLVEQLCAGDFEVIVNVGAAEGYFTVGMALRCPNARLYAFESDPQAANLLRQLAQENGVADRLEIRGHCTPEDLAAVLAQHPAALLIMDIEGGEDEVLRPEIVPPSCRVLVELHEFVVSGIGKKIAERFEATHFIVEVLAQERRLEDLPVRSRVLDRWLLKLMREFRPAPMSWYDMKPKANARSPAIPAANLTPLPRA